MFLFIIQSISFITATLVEETEDDNESIESVLSRGRGRSSRASSEDRSSSRGSSVQRNIGSSRASSKEDIELGISEHKYVELVYFYTEK